MMTILDFVTTFEQKLVRKPRLHPDVLCFLDLSVCGSILTGQRRCILICTCNVDNLCKCFFSFFDLALVKESEEIFINFRYPYDYVHNEY